MSDFEKLKNSFKQKILEAKDSKEIANISSEVFGKKGLINLEFSKIGSLPVKTDADIVSSSREVFDYLSGKASQGIEFKFNASTTKINLTFNKELYCWDIENLLNNAIDAVV